MRGQFEFSIGGQEPIILPNMIVHTGVEAILEKLFLDDGSTTLGADFYIGMLDEVPTKALTMAGVTTEPTAVGGYARLPISRVAAAWQIVAVGADGYRQAFSNTVVFTPVAVPYSRAFSRLFLSTALTGGTLISVSSALPNPFAVTPALPITVAYRFFLD